MVRPGEAKPMNLLEKIKTKKATVTVVGAGYVGLPTALLFAEKGFTVIAADKNPRVVECTNQGKSHINDPELNLRVPAVFATGRLSATLDVMDAARRSDAILVCVPTPTENHEPDLRYIESSAQDIGAGLKKDTLVVLESTVYPGVTENVLGTILEQKSGLCVGDDFHLAHCPERLNPGDTQHSIDNTPRIVGGINSASKQSAQALYESVGLKMHSVANIHTAEMVKLVENTQRDVNIAFINEMALLCEKIDVDAYELIQACSTKWNFYKLLPGPGVGGHCLPNNPYYIAKRAKEVGFEPDLMLTARHRNDEMPMHVVELVEKGLKESGKTLDQSTVALVGVAYKANVDDVRLAPSRVIADALLKKGASLKITDPHVNEANMKKVHDHVVELEEALACDAVVFLCAHDAYKEIRPQEVKATVVVDAVFLFSPSQFSQIYKGIGRSSTHAQTGK